MFMHLDFNKSAPGDVDHNEDNNQLYMPVHSGIFHAYIVSVRSATFKGHVPLYVGPIQIVFIRLVSLMDGN